MMRSNGPGKTSPLEASSSILEIAWFQNSSLISLSLDPSIETSRLTVTTPGAESTSERFVALKVCDSAFIHARSGSGMI